MVSEVQPLSNRCFSFFVWLLLFGVCCLPHRAWAVPLQSNHGVCTVVPTPGPVTIDGNLQTWDLSGEMYVYGVRALRDRYAARVYAMWDQQALYLGLKWRDPTPMINNVDADGAPGEGWMADCFQARFITDTQVHLTAWYSSKKDKCVAQLNYDSATNETGKRVFRAAGQTLHDPSGFEMAFQRDADNRGYVQEIRIPWNLLYRNGGFTPNGGAKYSFTGEYYWGGPSGTTWPAVMWSDPINQQNPVRVVIFQSPGVWGEMVLSPAGNLPKEATEDTDLRLQGPIPLRVEVPVDATRVSLVIDDAQGRRMRNLISHANVSDYLVKREHGKQILEVPWDGRADGMWDKERLLFLGDVVPPGTYTVRGLVHEGIGVIHTGSFYNPGTPPWPTADGTGAWGADHSCPSVAGAMPAAAKTKGRVFLGWPVGESGQCFIGVNADGRKCWEWGRRGLGALFIAANETSVYFIYDNGTGKVIGRVNPDTGDQLPFNNGALEIKLPGEPSGLAVHDHVLAVSLGAANKVQCFDADSGATTDTIDVPAPGYHCFHRGWHTAGNHRQQAKLPGCRRSAQGNLLLAAWHHATAGGGL